MAYTGTSASGATYNIGSDLGKQYIEGTKALAAGGTKMSDGSVWERQKDGSVTITTYDKNNNKTGTYSVSAPTQPAASGGGNTGAANTSGGNSSGGNSLGATPAGSAGSEQANAPAAAAATEVPKATTAATQQPNMMQGILDAMASGASAEEVKNLYEARQAYVAEHPELAQYRDDNRSMIMNYIINMAKLEQEGKRDLDWEAYQAELNKMNEELLARAQAANQAGVALSVEQIKANLENGLPGYSASAEEAYLKMLQSQRNQRLQSTYNGDMGGIGIKQYSDAAAQYDAALLQIALEKQAFINSSNQQIAQLQAEGRLQDAQILADWAQSKIDRYDQDFQWYNELLFKQEQADMQQGNLDREFAYNRAIGMLERGMVTADAIEALGISAEEAQDYANYYNQLAALNLREAEAQLSALYKSLNGSGDAGDGEGFSGTMLVTRKDGGYQEAITFKNGEPVGAVLQNGDTIVDDNGAMWYYHNGDFITQSHYDYLSGNGLLGGAGSSGNTEAAKRAWAQKYSTYAPSGMYNTPDALYNSLVRTMRELTDLRAQFNLPSGQSNMTAADVNRLIELERIEDGLNRALYDYESAFLSA